MTIAEPHYLSITRMGSSYEEELDVNAAPSDPNQYRHSIRSFTGQVEHDWVAGPAPVRGLQDGLK